MIKSLLEEQEETPKNGKVSKDSPGNSSLLSISTTETIEEGNAEKTDTSEKSEQNESSTVDAKPANKPDEYSDSGSKDSSVENTPSDEADKSKEDTSGDSAGKASELKKSNVKDLLSTPQIASNLGMALSMGVALFGSVVFMLIIGWIADTLLGTSPYGMVVGIIIGSLMGFVQLFRISARIVMPRKSDFDKVSFKAHEQAEAAEEEKVEKQDAASDESVPVSAENAISDTEEEIETILANKDSTEADEIAAALALIESHENEDSETSLEPAEEGSLDAFVADNIENTVPAGAADTDDGEVETLVSRSGEKTNDQIQEAIPSEQEE